MARPRQPLALAMIGAAWVGTTVAAPLAYAKGQATSYVTATTTASAFHVAFTQAAPSSIITGSLVTVPNPLSGLPGLDQVPGANLNGTFLGVLAIAFGTAGIFLAWRGSVAVRRRRLSAAGRGQ